MTAWRISQQNAAKGKLALRDPNMRRSAKSAATNWRDGTMGRRGGASPLDSDQEAGKLAEVAFLGLGVMGYPMAGHLQAKGGHRVRVYNRTRAKAEQWVAQFGGGAAATPRMAAGGCDFVFACVGADDDLRALALGDDGAFAGMKAGAIFGAHPTASAAVARELHAAAGRCALHFIQAPVSGGQARGPNRGPP